MNNITSTNRHNFCRTCLSELQGYGSNFTMNSMYNVHESKELSQWVVNCLPVPSLGENDCLPNFVCTGCYQQLQCFYEFREMSTRSMRTLWEILGLSKNGEENQTLDLLVSSNNVDEMKCTTTLTSERTKETVNHDVDDKNRVIQTLLESVRFEPENNIDGHESQFPHVDAIIPEVPVPINNEEMLEDAIDTLDISSNYNNAKKQLKNRSQPIASKFQCKECKRSYANQGNLDAHIRTCQGLKPFQCKDCDSNFNRAHHLRRHVECRHSESVQQKNTKLSEEPEKSTKTITKEKLKATQIDGNDGAETTSTDSRKDKRRQIITKEKQRKPVDVHCNDSSNDGDEDDKDYKIDDSDDSEESNYSETEKKTKRTPKRTRITRKKSSATSSTNPIKKKFIYKCEECNRYYASEETHAAHMRTHKGLPAYSCTKCPKSFKRSYHLRIHTLSIHTENAEPIICKVEGCGKSFRMEVSYRRHYRLRHTDAAPQLKVCEDCGRVLKSASSLREHRYTHAPREEYPFHCEQCDKRFSSQRTYKEHLLRHAGIKQFVCPHCGMRKTTRRELKTHIHYHTLEKRWSCPLCPSVFNRPENLTRHNRIVHIGLREHVCRYCNESFAKLETLRHHEMRHTGEKPHECHICQKRFIQLVALKTHMKTHAKCGITPELPPQPRKRQRQYLMQAPQQPEQLQPEEVQPQVQQFQKDGNLLAMP